MFSFIDNSGHRSMPVWRIFPALQALGIMEEPIKRIFHARARKIPFFFDNVQFWYETKRAFGASS
jgi:hypothetical protein